MAHQLCLLRRKSSFASSLTHFSFERVSKARTSLCYSREIVTEARLVLHGHNGCWSPRLRPCKTVFGLFKAIPWLIVDIRKSVLMHTICIHWASKQKKLLEIWSSCTQNHITFFVLFLILQATYIARHVSYDFIKFTISTWLQSLHCLINTESLKNIIVLRSGIDCCKRRVLRYFWARQSTLIQGVAGKKQAYCQLPTTEKCFSRTLSPLHHVSALCYKGKDSWAQRQTRSPDWNHDIILTLCENRKR